MLGEAIGLPPELLGASLLPVVTRGTEPLSRSCVTARVLKLQRGRVVAGASFLRCRRESSASLAEVHHPCTSGMGYGCAVVCAMAAAVRVFMNGRMHKQLDACRHCRAHADVSQPWQCGRSVP